MDTVAVIGGGIAGLAAAKVLGDAGIDVVLCEARPRLGGRTYTITSPGLAAPVELGGEYVHGRPAGLLRVLRDANIDDVEVSGDRWEMHEHAGRLLGDDTYGSLAQVIAAARSLRSDMTVDAFLAAHPAIDAATAARLRYTVAGFDAADPALASVRAIADEWAGDAGINTDASRPVGGYGRVVDFIARGADPQRVRLLTRTVIDGVTWERGAVRVTGTRLGAPFALNARAAVIALPIGVLRAQDGAGAIAFVPALPPEKRAAIAGIAMGPVVKVVLQFQLPFWKTLRDERFGDAGFFQVPGKPFPTLWSQYPLHVPTLTAWVGGPGAAALGGLDETATIRTALGCVAAAFGPDIVDDAFVAGFVHAWDRDPFSRGAYSYVLAGAADARAALGASLDGTLFFAGEATAGNGEGGTVGGAYASGTRVAGEVLAAYGVPAPAEDSAS